MISLIKTNNGIFHKGSRYFTSKNSWIGTLVLVLFLIPVTYSLFAKFGTIDKIETYTKRYDDSHMKLLRPPDYILFD